MFEFSGALTGHELSSRYDWFHGKAYRLKKQVIDAYARFCQDPKVTELSTSEPPWLHRWVVQLWRDTLNGSLLTFDGLRKMAHLQHWMKGVLDERYARVFVDEAQDFDPLMLDILLNDVTVPKVFVGTLVNRFTNGVGPSMPLNNFQTTPWSWNSTRHFEWVNRRLW